MDSVWQLLVDKCGPIMQPKVSKKPVLKTWEYYLLTHTYILSMFNGDPSCNVLILTFSRAILRVVEDRSTLEFKLEVWMCNLIQDANLADKEASKTIPRTQFELDSPYFEKGKPATGPPQADSTPGKWFRALVSCELLNPCSTAE